MHCAAGRAPAHTMHPRFLVFLAVPPVFPFVLSRARSASAGIIDCTARALETGLHVHQHDAFGHMPQMKKVLCLDNDLRRRFTTRGLFEELLGGYNTL